MVSAYIQNEYSGQSISAKYNDRIISYRNARDLLRETLRDMDIFINSGLSDMRTCYITNMPDAIIDSIYKFLDYREQTRSRPVSKYISQSIQRITYVEPSYYVAGRILWCVGPNGFNWGLGVILPCGPNKTALISAYDPITDNTHTGYHIKLRTGHTIYIPSNRMAVSTSIRKFTNLLASPQHIPYTDDYAPWGRYPHSVSVKGVYMCYDNFNAPTASSNCCILRYIPDISYSSVGNIIPIDNTNIDIVHQLTAAMREDKFPNAYTDFENISPTN